MRKALDDEVTVQLPGGERVLTIVAIRYEAPAG
jgi:transcription elongation GreA/GreB family factor